MKCSNKNCKHGELKETDFQRHREGRFKECKYCRREKQNEANRKKREENRKYIFA